MNILEVKPTGVLSGGSGMASLVFAVFTDKFGSVTFLMLGFLPKRLFLGLPRPLILSFSFRDKSTLNKGPVDKEEAGIDTGSGMGTAEGAGG